LNKQSVTIKWVAKTLRKHEKNYMFVRNPSFSLFLCYSLNVFFAPLEGGIFDLVCEISGFPDVVERRYIYGTLHQRRG
jgi:hypothetical protein